MEQVETETLGLTMLGSCPRTNTNGLAEGGSAIRGPPEFCFPGHSREREWPHGTSPGQELHLFQVTRVLANPVHHEAASVPATEGTGNRGPEGKAELHWEPVLRPSRQCWEEDRAPMPPAYPECLGTRGWAGGMLRPTPKPRSPLQGEPPLPPPHNQPHAPDPLLPPNLYTPNPSSRQLPQRVNTCLGRLIPKAGTCPCSLGPPPLSPLVTQDTAYGPQRPVDIHKSSPTPKRPMDRTASSTDSSASGTS